MRRTTQQVRAELEERRAAYERTKKRQRQRLLCTVPLAVTALICAAVLVPWTDMLAPPDLPASSPNQPDAPQSADPLDPTDPPKGGDPFWPLDVYMGGGSYSDGVDSFKELLEAAELIVVGTVVDTASASSVSETATVRVDTVYRDDGDEMRRGGKDTAEIRLYQLKQGHTVKVGRSYLLFLKKQAGDDKDAFYVIGGGQGAIGYDTASGRVSASSPRIDEEDVRAWLDTAIAID